MLLRQSSSPSRTRRGRSSAGSKWAAGHGRACSRGPIDAGDWVASEDAEIAGRVRCPVLVIHGREDGICPPSHGVAPRRRDRRAARHDRGQRPRAERCATRCASTCYSATSCCRRRRRPLARTRARPQRALFVSSPIGLGHVRRDLAIARRAAPAAPEPRDRLARPAARDRAARGERRARAPGERRARGRVRPHRVRGRRAPPTGLRCAAAHGRDPGRELHALPRRRAGGGSTTSGSATRPGMSITSCTRIPELKRRLRLADRLRRLPAAARGRRARGVPDGRLQRGDDRAGRALSARARRGNLRRRSRRHRVRSLRAWPTRDPAVGRAALRVHAGTSRASTR